MNLKEKKLYHQIHPVKLLVDWGTGTISLYFIWLHEVGIGLIIMFVPAFIASFLIIQFVDLSKYKESSFGTYIKVHMTSFWEVVRFIGFLVAVIGAWFHFYVLIVIGILIVILGWAYGIIFNR